jgi:uncharacterized membrane protein YagU involved in acid resistance
MPKAMRISALKIILCAGLLAAALDILDPILFYGARGVSAIRILQSVAAGLYGRATYAGGLRTALIGLALHTLIALIWAALFVFAARSVNFLSRQAVVSGLLYGAFIYIVMNFVILPHSHVTHGPRPSGIVLVNAIAAIVFLVGLPISLVNKSFTTT